MKDKCNDMPIEVERGDRFTDSCTRVYQTDGNCNLISLSCFIHHRCDPGHTWVLKGEYYTDRCQNKRYLVGPNCDLVIPSSSTSPSSGSTSTAARVAPSQSPSSSPSQTPHPSPSKTPGPSPSKSPAAKKRYYRRCWRRLCY